MKKHPCLIVLVASLTTFSVIAAPEKAPKEKRANVADYPFWATKKRAESPQFLPGLNAVLQLTPAQEEQIANARTEMSNDEAFKAARTLPKGDASVTAEQREKARAVIEAANTKLREQVAKILTPDQAALVAKINTAYQATLEEIGTVYEDKYGSVKNDEAARRRLQEEKNQDIEDHFLHKLDAILTPAQKDAMAKSAQDERNAQGAATKKPAK